ncbi:hypothetical protein F8S13_02420 [Chloroflexia bacterium SDU3-3]|nr:hypothetical protein F8S13_02420 [Chloroflexia bacterium SDU3-3]
MNKERIWTPYDPQWLIDLAQEQRPEDTWLPQALAACTQALQVSEGYVYFVDSSNANQPGSAWQFKTNISLESPTEGWITLDILTKHRVGGIEFYNKLLKGPGVLCPCGFMHNYTNPSQHELVIIPRTDIRDNTNRYGSMYECPACGRLIWRKPGSTTYTVFAPEGTA